MMKWLKRIIMLLVFIVSLAFIIYGEMQTGALRLAVMLIGLAGVIALLFTYNNKYRN